MKTKLLHTLHSLFFKKENNKKQEKKAPKTKKQKVLKTTKLIVLSILICFVFLYLLGGVVEATGGLVDDTINTEHEYSKYSLDNYTLDFYVDTSWGWLPWNWGSSIGKQVSYGLYAVTNFIWTISCYISNATGYLVKEAYSLDFIGDTANAIGKNIQTIAGVSKEGFSTDGFYINFLLIFILILGVYVSYVGLLKRETTKAIRAITNFVIVFLISASFIAYAPDYITKINDFSKDISQTALTVGTKIIMPNSEAKGQESVDLIRDSLFAIQVKNPWLLLQYGTSDMEVLGEERIESLLSNSPDEEAREDVVIQEIEEEGNKNLTVTKTISRLGTVTFLFLFNIGISIFVFLLTGIMIFSQVLFIIYAMFLPMGFLLSMIPTYEHMGKRAIEKLFNTIMSRAGITLIITIAFSISTMLYNLSTDAPFFFIAFLQIITFAGIYLKLGDLMGMFALHSNDSKSIANRVLRSPKMFMVRQARSIQRSMKQALGTNKKQSPTSKSSHRNGSTKERPMTNETTNIPNKATLSQSLGKKVGQTLDTKNRVKHNFNTAKDKVKNIPTNARYKVRKSINAGRSNLDAFQKSVAQIRAKNERVRSFQQANRRMNTLYKKQYINPIQQRSNQSDIKHRSDPELPIKRKGRTKK